MNTRCSCACGESQLALEAKPLVRFYCHCTICQMLYQEPFADVTAFRVKQIDFQKQASIKFKRFRLPPALNRGICQSYNRPLVGLLRLAPFLRLAFVPTKNIPNELSFVEPSLHLFYHRRNSEVDDQLPKYCGYWKSETAISARIISALIR